MKIVLILTALIFTSCATKKGLNQQSETEFRQLLIDNKMQIQELQEEVAKLNGRIEEVEYFGNKNLDEKTRKNQESINVIEERLKYIDKKQTSVENFDNNIRKYLDLLKEGKLVQARNGLYTLIGYNGVDVRKRATALYNLALVEYKLKNLDEAKKYFTVINNNIKEFNVEKYKSSVIYHLGSIAKFENDCESFNSYKKNLELNSDNNKGLIDVLSLNSNCK